MKPIFIPLTPSIFGLLMLLSSFSSYSQSEAKRPGIAIMFIESHGLKFDSVTIAGLAGIEIEKTGKYHVMDR